MSEPKVKPKVLVADDERVIADTLSIILNQAGFEATAVYSGEKAVETAKTLKPDMLISDVIMTDMNGIDAAIKIRGMLPSCKILLFSGQAATADLLERARVQGHEFADPGQAGPSAGSAGASAELTLYFRLSQTEEKRLRDHGRLLLGRSLLATPFHCARHRDLSPRIRCRCRQGRR